MTTFEKEKLDKIRQMKINKVVTTFLGLENRDSPLMIFYLIVHGITNSNKSRCIFSELAVNYHAKFKIDRILLTNMTKSFFCLLL